MVIWLDPNFPRDTRPATVTASQSHPHKYIAISLHKYKLVPTQILAYKFKLVHSLSPIHRDSPRLHRIDPDSRKCILFFLNLGHRSVLFVEESVVIRGVYCVIGLFLSRRGS